MRGSHAYGTPVQAGVGAARTLRPLQSSIYYMWVCGKRIALTRKSILLVQTACQSVVEAARWVARERVGVVRPVDLGSAAGSLCVALFGAACWVENVAVLFIYIYYFFSPPPSPPSTLVPPAAQQ